MTARRRVRLKTCWRIVKRRSSTRELIVERTYPSGTLCGITRIVVLDLYFSGATTL